METTLKILWYVYITFWGLFFLFCFAIPLLAVHCLLNKLSIKANAVLFVFGIACIVIANATSFSDYAIYENKWLNPPTICLFLIDLFVIYGSGWRVYQHLRHKPDKLD